MLIKNRRNEKPKIVFDFLKENVGWIAVLFWIFNLGVTVYFITLRALTHATDRDLLMRYSFEINSTVFQANATFIGFILLIFSFNFGLKDFEMDKVDYNMLKITFYILCFSLFFSLFFGLNPTINPDIMDNQIALIISVEIIVILLFASIISNLFEPLKRLLRKSE